MILQSNDDRNFDNRAGAIPATDTNVRLHQLKDKNMKQRGRIVQE